MRAQLPSQTAMFVALLRALAHRGFTRVRGFEDPFAEKLLPGPWRALLRLLVRWLERMRPYVRGRVIEQLDVVAQRVVAIDRELEVAVAGGCEQVVNLGAGADARAFRLRSLASVDVFEADHPATQRWKRGKAAGLRVAARRLQYVPVDLEKQALAPELAAAGHRVDAPTVWICEGVVMYLTPAALRAALETLFDLSAPGSTLIVNYHEPSTDRSQLARHLGLTRLLGEPQLGLRTRESMIEEIEGAGFRPLRDTCLDAKFRVARLLVADKPASES